MKNKDLAEHSETSMSIRTQRINCIFGYSTLFGNTKIVWFFGNSIKVDQERGLKTFPMWIEVKQKSTKSSILRDLKRFEIFSSTF